MWQGYVADMLCACARGIYGFGGKRLDIEPFTKLRQEIDKPAKKRHTDMTAEEVVNHILSEVSALGGNGLNETKGDSGP